MLVHAIVAAANGGVIGKDNEIPWYLPADFKYFKKITTGHPIIMGRKCFESIGRPLPKRTNIIITRNPYYAVSNALVCHSLTEAFELALDTGADACFVIGGGEIYKEALPFYDKIYYTEVTLDVAGDTFFPELDMNTWQLESEDPQTPDEKNPLPYNFKVYTRI